MVDNLTNSALFFELAKNIRQIIGFDISIVWHLKKREHKLRVVASDGIQQIDDEYAQTVLLDPESLEFLRRGSPKYLSDITSPQKSPHFFFRDMAIKRGWVSLISVPLIRRQRIIGLIDSYTLKPFKFLDDEHKYKIMSILCAFGNQAAETIRNIELSNQLQVLQSISEILADTFDEKTVVRSILSKALDLVGTDIGWLYLIDITTEKLILNDYLGVPDKFVDKMRDLGEGITGYVGITGKTLNIPDVSQAPKYRELQTPEVKSKIAVPLKRGEQTIGVLTVKSRFLDSFSEDDEDLLSSLATQAAIAIERAKLNKHLQQISRLALTTDYSELANYIITAVKDLTGAEVNLWVESEKEGESGKYLRVIAGERMLKRNYTPNTILPIIPGSSITALSLEKKQPIVKQDIFFDDPAVPRFYNMNEARRRNWKSFMAVPLIGRDGERLGALSLYSQTVNKFRTPDVELMMIFANQAAFALQQQKRSQTLQKFVQVGETLTKEIFGRPHNILEEITQSACKLIQADCAVIYPYDPIKNQFYEQDKIGVFGLKAPKTEVTEKPREKGLAALVRMTMEIVVHDLDNNNIEINLEGISQEEVLRIVREAKFVQREDIKAFIGIPLKVGESETSQSGKVQEFGVLYIDFRHPHHFTRDELQIIRIYAHQVANIIRGARLYVEAQRQTSELEAIYDTTLKIVAQEAHENINTLLQSIVDEATQILKAQGGVLYLSIPNNEKLKIVAVNGIDPIFLKIGDTISFGEGMAGRVILSQEPMIIDNYESWSGRIDKLAHLFTAVIEVPFIIDKKPIGVLAIFDDFKRRKFTDDDIPILKRLAQQAALVIHNVRLLDERKKQFEELKVLDETSREIVGESESLGQVLNKILQKAVELSNAEGGQLLLRHDDTGEVKVVLTHKLDKLLGKKLDSGEGLASKVVETGVSQFTNDYPNSPYKVDFFNEPQYKELIGKIVIVPLKRSNIVIGLLAISTSIHSNRAFTNEDVRFLERFAGPAAIAITKAREISFRQTLFNNSPIAIIAIDTKGRITKINDEGLRLLGYKLEQELIGKFVQNIIYWNGLDEARRIFALLEQKIAVTRIETYLRSRENERIPILLSAALLKDEQDELLGSIGVMEDQRITALGGRVRKLFDAIEAIDRSQGLQDVLDTVILQSIDLFEADIGCVLLNSDGHLKIEASYGCSKDIIDKVAQRLSNGLLGQLAKEEKPIAISSLSNQDKDIPFSTDGKSALIIHLKKDNQILVGIIYLESYILEHFNAESDLIPIFATHTRVAINRAQLLEEREKTREGLFASAHAVAAGQIATGFVHEVKNSLNTIALTVDNIGEKIQKDPDIKDKSYFTKKIKGVETEILRASELSQRLQRFGQRLAPNKEYTYLNEIVSKIFELLASSLNQRKLKIDLKFDPALDRPKTGTSKEFGGNPVYLDKGQIEQVIINLILNAIDVSRFRGLIVVETKLHTDKVEIRIIDYGDGIKPDVISEIFNPFFTTKPDGVGLGLYISKIIIEDNHQGRIDVKSKGKGTTFSIFLPFFKTK